MMHSSHSDALERVTGSEWRARARHCDHDRFTYIFTNIEIDFLKIGPRNNSQKQNKSAPEICFKSETGPFSSFCLSLSSNNSLMTI